MRRARSEDAKDERRQLLLSAALDEFFESGFSAARIEDIAQRASLSKGTVYLYFDSKEALFLALIEDLATPNIEQIEQIAALAPSLREALNRLAVFAPMMIRTSNLPRLMKVLIGDSHTFPEIIRDYRKQKIERILGALTGFLDRAVDRGEIAPQNTSLTTRLILAPIVLSGMWQAVFGRDADAEVDLEALFHLHTELLLKALAPENTKP